MKPLRLSSLGAVLAALSLMIGCCNKEKQQIVELQAEYNRLAAQNSELRSKLSQTKTREEELARQTEAKDLQLSGKSEEISVLKGQLAAKPVPATPPDTPRAEGGWDIGKFADKITVGSDILFASGRATLTAKGKSTLSKIVADLRGKYRGMPVRVYGYTDSDPIKRTKRLWKDNLDLSSNRAMAVTRYLIDQGIDPDLVETIGMGASHFISANDSRTGKARNRRVEIVVIKE